MSASESELEVSEILGERKNRNGLEYLVRWKNFGKDDDSWEPLKNLVNAVKAIADFKTRLSSTKKRSPKKSKSRSRSRSRSRGRSSSKSPGRPRKGTSPSRSSRKSTTTTVTKTPTVQETKTEVVTTSPGKTEMKTETITQSLLTPATTQRISQVTRSTEVRTSSTRGDAAAPQKETPGILGGLCGCWRSVCDSTCGLVRSDYPAIVVFTTIAIIILSFIVQDNVDFEKVWAAIVGFFVGIWTWVTELVPQRG